MASFFFFDDFQYTIIPFSAASCCPESDSLLPPGRSRGLHASRFGRGCGLGRGSSRGGASCLLGREYNWHSWGQYFLGRRIGLDVRHLVTMLVDTNDDIHRLAAVSVLHAHGKLA